VATVYWTPRQAEFIDALVELGYYGTQTEVGRAAVEKLIRDLSAHQRREIALRLYEKGHATVSRVAEIADIPVEQARSLVKEAGLLREGTEESLTDRRGKVRAAAKRLR
jgi:Arc/MetJ-type ribon-helix-helix transcriptional regulator